jgi:1-aminocyclopropane-1-carboxylate deaminase
VSQNLHPQLQALERQFSASTLTRIDDGEFSRRGLEVLVKRDDLLHPVISGNKWRKLKYILEHALKLDAECIVSMGGAYSNHLHALAFAGKILGLTTKAYVRGERPSQLNPTLLDLQHWGMELNFVSRSDYRQLRTFRDHDSLPGLRAGEYWLPEGGASELGLRGVAEIVGEIDCEYDVLATACGTGTTLAGLIAAAPESARVLGVAALKGAAFLHDEVKKLLPDDCRQAANWKLLTDYHHGGFAKTTPQLLEFIRQFYDRHGIALEPVYTGKLLFAIYELVKQDYFAPGQRIVVLHTGGLQGERTLSGYNPQFCVE